MWRLMRVRSGAFVGAAALTTVLAAPLAAQVPSRSVTIARIDSIADAMLAAPVAGFQVAVVKGSDTLVMKGYGMANIELGVPVTPATVFAIGCTARHTLPIRRCHCAGLPGRSR
jgi:D-alanyl-D-alanine carboxypeptidase